MLCQYSMAKNCIIFNELKNILKMGVTEKFQESAKSDKETSECKG